MEQLSFSSDYNDFGIPDYGDYQLGFDDSNDAMGVFDDDNVMNSNDILGSGDDTQTRSIFGDDDRSIFGDNDRSIFGDDELTRSVLVEEEEIQLSPVPDYYEMFTSVVSSKPAVATFAELKQYLTDQKHDFRDHPDKAQIQAVVSDDAQVCMVNINLFNCEGEHHGQHGVLVECHRQQGCSTVFHEFQTSVSNLFRSQPRRGFMRPPALRMNALDQSAQALVRQQQDIKARDEVQHLLSMAACCLCSKTRKELLSSLCHATKQECNQDILASRATEVAAVVKNALESHDDIIKRAGAVLLERLADLASRDPSFSHTLSPVVSACLDEQSQDSQCCFQQMIRQQTQECLRMGMSKMQSSAVYA